MVLYPFFLSVAVTQYPLFLSQFHSSTHSFSQSQLHNTIPVFYPNSTSNLLFSSDRPMYLSILFNTNILFILIFCCTPYFFRTSFCLVSLQMVYSMCLPTWVSWPACTGTNTSSWDRSACARTSNISSTTDLTLWVFVFSIFVLFSSLWNNQSPSFQMPCSFKHYRKIIAPNSYKHFICPRKGYRESAIFLLNKYVTRKNIL